MTERQALVGAGLAHILLFAALSLGWSMLKQPAVIEEAVPVELVDIAPDTRVTEKPQPSKAAAPQETAAPEPQPEVVKPEPTPPAPVPDAVPTPEPKPVEKPKPEKPKPEKPVEKPVDKPVKPKPVKTEPKPQRFDTAELDSLIDKALPKAPKKVRDPDAFAKSITMSIPKSARLDARATASLVAAIRAQIAPCWNPPIGGAGVGKMTVLLSIQLGRDGSVLGRPTVLGVTGGGSNAGYAKAFADTAVRAVLRCAPLKLPADQFEAWKAFELNFDPSEMT